MLAYIAYMDPMGFDVSKFGSELPALQVCYSKVAKPIPRFQGSTNERQATGELGEICWSSCGHNLARQAMLKVSPFKNDIE